MRNALFTAFTAISFAFLTGCSDSTGGSSDASSASSHADTGSAVEAQPSAATAPATEPVDKAAQLKRGGIVFLRCRSCHTLAADDVHLIGPNLNGLLGAKAASKSGFRYSPALQDSGVTWSEESLDAWIKEPSVFIPNNMMVLAGMPDARDRAALIAYLVENTK